jgi:hypothetical protein
MNLEIRLNYGTLKALPRYYAGSMAFMTNPTSVDGPPRPFSRNAVQLEPCELQLR